MRYVTRISLAVVLLLAAVALSQNITIIGPATLKGPIRITILPPGVVPPTPPEITTASPVQPGTQDVFHTVNFAATGGTLPYVWSVGPTGAAITTWTAANNDPAFVETVGDPTPCALDNAWPDSGGVTVDSTGKLTGDCSVKKIVSTASVLRDGFSRERLWVQYEIRPETWPTSLQLTGVGMLDVTSATNHCAVSVDQTGAYFVRSSRAGAGGYVALFTGTLDREYRIDLFAETTGIASGSKCHAIAYECTVRDGSNICTTWTDVSGGVKESNDGTWTEPIARLRASAANDTFWFDEIKQCNVGWNYLDECDGTATNLWSATVAACPVALYINDVLVSAALWSCSGTTITLTHGADPDTVTVEGGYLSIPGMTLSAAGVLSGTPTAADTYGFDVRVTDAQGLSDTETFSLVVAAPPGEEDPEPWEREFTALQTHYVSTTGTGNGAIGTPESLDTAIGHVIPGDYHILRTGTYAGIKIISRDCTSANPCRWGAYIDPATGDPENAQIGIGWQLTGDWHWIWPMYQINSTTQDTGSGTVEFQATGSSIINSLFQGRPRASCLDAFAYGPGMVIYGYTGVACGCDQQVGDNTGPKHVLYTQNRKGVHGDKYGIQITGLDQGSAQGCDPPSGALPSAVNFNASGTSQAAPTNSRLSGLILKDSGFQGGTLNLGTSHTSYGGAEPGYGNEFDNLWIDSMLDGKGMQTGNQGWASFVLTNSLVRNSLWELRAAGQGETCWPVRNANQVENNRIYNPPTGQYLSFMTRRSIDGSPCTRQSSVDIRDADVWNNNTYGRSSGTGTFSLEVGGLAVSTGNTLAQWRTKTAAARDSSGVAFDAASTEGGLPSVDEHECFANFYNPNWGKCRAIDWDGNGTVILSAAEVQKIVGNGKTYKVRNERNFFGAPLESGTYTTGAGITVSPMPADAVSAMLWVWITSQP